MESLNHGYYEVHNTKNHHVSVQKHHGSSPTWNLRLQSRQPWRHKAGLAQSQQAVPGLRAPSSVLLSSSHCCASDRHVVPTLPTHWHHLRSFTKYWCLCSPQIGIQFAWALNCERSPGDYKKPSCLGPCQTEEFHPYAFWHHFFFF